MSKNVKVLARGEMLTLAHVKAYAENVLPETLEAFLHRARQNCHAFELRIKIAQETGDSARVENLNKDTEFARWKKRRDYYLKEIETRFPAHKVAPANLKSTEREIIVNDYLSALRLKRDAQIMAQAARALDDETEKKMALQDMQRALKYIKVLEPKFKKIESELNKTASK